VGGGPTARHNVNLILLKALKNYIPSWLAQNVAKEDSLFCFGRHHFPEKVILQQTDGFFVVTRFSPCYESPG